MNDNLINLLETVICLQMTLESLETLQGTHYNKQRLKQVLKATIREIEPLVNRDYGIVFANGESETQNIIFEYEKLVKYIAVNNLPKKVILAQFIEAWDLDKKSVEGLVHRIINKPKKYRLYSE